MAVGPFYPGYGVPDPVIYRPEKLKNYEVGFKVAALDRRLQVNAAAFYMDYTDMQVTATGNRGGIPVPYVENVGSAAIKGFELEAVALPAPQWKVVFNGSYTDADIKEWTSRQIPLVLTAGTVDATRPYYFIDRSDERMPRVPRWQFFVSNEYNFALPWGGTLTPQVGVRFTSSIYHGFDRGSWVQTYGGYQFNDNGQKPNPSWTITSNPNIPRYIADPLVTPTPDKKWATTSRPTAFLDARLSWISEDGKIEGAFWGKNLFNKEDYLVGGIPLADVLGSVGQIYANPRTFGLTVSYRFAQ